jgi:hypothetical protein
MLHVDRIGNRVTHEATGALQDLVRHVALFLVPHDAEMDLRRGQVARRLDVRDRHESQARVLDFVEHDLGENFLDRFIDSFNSIF